jgi:hypothetical protein
MQRVALVQACIFTPLNYAVDVMPFAEGPGTYRFVQVEAENA